MRKYILFINILFFVYSCGTETKKVSSYGENINEENAHDVSHISELIKGKDTLRIKLTGKITEVCQKKGCWMDIDLNNGQTMRVTFKDYAFFVPKDVAGKTTVFEGLAFIDTSSVDKQKHYAEDAGKSMEEIEKITEPEINISFEANGVIIKNEKEL